MKMNIYKTYTYKGETYTDLDDLREIFYEESLLNDYEFEMWLNDNYTAGDIWYMDENDKFDAYSKCEEEFFNEWIYENVTINYR